MINMNKNFILNIIICGIWGWFQPVIFPQEQYGFLWLLTAFLGGALISIIIKLLDR